MLNMSSPTAIAEIGQMYLDLGKAISLLGAMQQCPMSTDLEGSFDAHNEFCVDSEYEVFRIARNIAESLTGIRLKQEKE